MLKNDIWQANQNQPANYYINNIKQGIAIPYLTIYFNPKLMPQVQQYISNNVDKVYIQNGMIYFCPNQYINQYVISVFNKFIVEVDEFISAIQLFIPNKVQESTYSVQNQFKVNEKRNREQQPTGTFTYQTGQDMFRYKEDQYIQQQLQGLRQ